MDRREMLSDKSLKYLQDVFFWRKVRNGSSKKFAIPIGLQELRIGNVIERETKNGKRLVEMRFYMAPSETMYGEEVSRYISEDKISFAPIKAYHVVGDGHIKDFYKRFSAMKPSHLDQLHELKGKRFKGLVKHVAHDSMRGDEILRTDDGLRKKFWMQEIIAVTKVEDDMEYDHLDLVDFGFQDVKKLYTIDDNIPF